MLDIVFNSWVEVVDIIRSWFILFILIWPPIKIVWSSFVPDPAENETRHLSKHWYNPCDNIVNDLEDGLDDIILL